MSIPIPTKCWGVTVVVAKDMILSFSPQFSPA
jgi:hypothetical protein